jgi:hypothetical protein
MSSSSRWLPCVLLSVLSFTTGCGYYSKSTPAASPPAHVDNTYPNIPETSLQDCPDHCLDKTLVAVRAKLGLDPNGPKQEGSKEVEEIVRDLQAECGTSGSTVSEIAVGDLLNDPNSKEQFPGFLMDSNGHLHLLLGVIISADGQPLYQLVHGTSAIALLKKSEITQDKFPKSWRLHGGKQGVPLAVGGGVLRVSSLDHNFGAFLPNEKGSHTFTLTNAGNTALVVGKPHTSCGCTTTSLTDDAVLKPGQSTNITVELASSNVASVRQYVYFKVTEAETNTDRPVVLSLFGSQMIFKSVVPHYLDFGTVQPESSLLQSVSITESPLDRFTITQIDSSTAPSLKSTSETFEARDDLHRYKITFKLDVGDQSPGKRQQIVHVITNSRFSPDIAVPVKFEVAPTISVVPNVIAMGEVPVGAVHNYLIRFKSAIGRPFEVKLKSVPPEATCRLEEKADCVQLTVTINLSIAGLWQKNIVVNVVSDSHEDVVEIKCSGLGKQLKVSP